ncbi:hypothetical protein [Oscillibacter sp. GMB15532]|uniref:alginate O-acetyltransferase AlgX-related protein n=1 Tax=Oscillibacter sp. GMB15532 TaxID=3230022 RepID=UPI0034DE9309
MKQSGKTELYRRAAGILLLPILLAAGGFALYTAGNGAVGTALKFDLWENRLNPGELQSSVEKSMRTDLPKQTANLVYSAALVAQGRRTSGDFYILKDDEGFLYRTNLYQAVDPDVMEYAQRLERLRMAAQKTGASVLFVGASGKLTPGVSQFPSGYTPDYASLRNLDELFIDLMAVGVDTLDLRESFREAPLAYDAYYYRTDVKWTARAAQFAALSIAQRLEELFGLQLDPSGWAADPARYEETVYPGQLLGNEGRASGLYWSGTDDFVTLAPSFATDLTVELTDESDHETSRRGTFNQTILDLTEVDELAGAPGNLFPIYYGKRTARVEIENHKLPEGARVLLVCDENFFSTAAYLSMMCARVDAVEISVNSAEQVERMVSSGGYDCIVVACQSQSIGAAMFPFFEE